MPNRPPRRRSSWIRCSGDAGAAGPERVPDRDGAAVHVGPVARQPELLLHRQVLRREGLVHLEEVEVGELRPGPGHGVPDRRHRADAHDRGVDAGDAPVDEPGQRREPASVGPRAARHDQHGGAVGDAAGRAGVDDAVLLEDLGELAQPLHAWSRGGGARPSRRSPCPCGSRARPARSRPGSGPPPGPSAMRRCERTLNSSTSSWVIPYCSASFSAVSAMGMLRLGVGERGPERSPRGPASCRAARPKRPPRRT